MPRFELRAYNLNVNGCVQDWVEIDVDKTDVARNHFQTANIHIDRTLISLIKLRNVLETHLFGLFLLFHAFLTPCPRTTTTAINGALKLNLFTTYLLRRLLLTKQLYKVTFCIHLYTSCIRRLLIVGLFKCQKSMSANAGAMYQMFELEILSQNFILSATMAWLWNEAKDRREKLRTNNDHSIANIWNLLVHWCGLQFCAV